MHTADPDPGGLPTRSYRILAIAILIAVGVIAVYAAAAPTSLETHEIFVAQTTREMIDSGEPIVPMFGGEPRLQKPPLMYWAVAAAALATGHRDVPPWVARLPSAIATVVLVAACIGIGARVYDRRTGLIAGAMVGFCAGVFSYGSNARPEMLYAACTAVATLGFVGAARALPPFALRWALVAWIATGLAVLAKGPQLPVLILLGLSFHHIRTSGWRAWARAFHPFLGFGIVAAIVAPWFIAVAVRIDGAFAFWTNELIGLRFASSSASESTFGARALEWVGDVLTPEYLLYAIAQLLPWGLVLPVAFFVPWVRNRPDLARGRDLFWAMIVPLAVLSLASRSREYYLLPLLPIIGVLVARGTIDVLEKVTPPARASRILAAGLWIIAAGAPVFAIIFAIDATPSVVEFAPIIAAFLLGALAIAMAAKFLPRPSSTVRPIAVAVVAWAASFAAVGQMPAIWSDRPDRIDDVAIEVDAQADASTLPVLAVGFDRDDLVYRVSAEIIRLPRSADVADAMAHVPAVVVASPAFLDLLAEAGCIISGSETITIEDEMQFRIATVTLPPEPVMPQAP